jgi:arylsulfatase A-like enzyme
MTLAASSAGGAGAWMPTVSAAVDQPRPVGRPYDRAAGEEPTQPSGPIRNILWICTDQQRWDTMGVTGNRFVRTPNLDKLANEGVLFENTYCNNPVCMPSRSSFLTGTYPSTVEVPTNGYEIKDRYLHRLITYRLHKLGYNNGLSGKLHIRGSHPGNPALPESGYDHGYDEFNWSPCGFPANWGGCQYQHWLRDRGVPFNIEDHSLSKHVQVGVAAEHHQTTWCAQRAITFMQGMAETNPDQPWMFACNIFDPHNPNDPPPELLERYMDMLDEIPLPNYAEGELRNKPTVQQQHHAAANKRMPPHPLRYDELSDREHRLYRASYYAMIDLIDQQVGRIMQTLEETGQRDNTLVIFTSDHGESLGDHGLYWKNWWFYEESMRVPLIMSWPGMKPRTRRVTESAELVDIVPTIYDAIGTNKPDWLQGRSWWDFLNGGEPVNRDFAFAEAWSGESRDVAMVRTQNHKLVRHYVADEGELYDLRDPHLERVNHWNEPAYAEVQADLHRKLDRRRAEVRSARIPDPAA